MGNPGLRLGIQCAIEGGGEHGGRRGRREASLRLELHCRAAAEPLSWSRGRRRDRSHDLECAPGSTR
jgi:hypothetical protein